MISTINCSLSIGYPFKIIAALAVIEMTIDFFYPQYFYRCAQIPSPGCGFVDLLTLIGLNYARYCFAGARVRDRHGQRHVLCYVCLSFPSRNKTKLFSFFRYCFLCSWELEPVAAFIVHKDSPVETATNTRFYFELFVFSGYRVSIELYLDTD